MEQEILKRLGGIESLVQDLASATARGFAVLSKDLEDVKDETKLNFGKVNDEFEKVHSKIDGMQRTIDAGFERHSSLETRVSKIEAEM